MYTIHYMAQDLSKGILMLNGSMVCFETYVEAWNFITMAMSEPQHPRFMWVGKELLNEDVQC